MSRLTSSEPKARVSCKRSWEVEALHHGRLADKDRTSLERHAEQCAECTRTIARLRELGAALAAIPSPEPTDLERRRARADLLARANDAVVGADRRPRRWPVLAVAGAVVAIVLVFFASTQRRAPAPPPVAATAAPLFDVADVDHADFTSERVDAISRVTLRSGTASFHVEHVKPDARFLVALPDGEVEVRGTRFVVEVTGGHTRSVAVTEGVVAVRVSGFEGILRAGERWPHVESAVAPPPSSPSLQSSASVAPSHGRVEAPARRLAGPRFAAAMSAINAGDYGEADRLFVAFVREFPTDTRAEDAMFLLADARSRRGDAAGARDAARAYLQRFPSGLRAPAAARLADDAAPPRP